MHAAPRLPGFTLLQRLGGGPLTSVFEARDLSTGDPCAVKVLRPDFDDQPTAARLLTREARAGLALRHPHLVRVTRAHVLADPRFLVMELLPGESVRRRMQREYRVGVREAVWMARQAAEALACMHAAGYLHGDIKPDNLRLVDDGTVVLTDLGFAHRPGENAAFLRDGYLLGTANYMAPEQADDWPVEDFASDVFSLGATLFEMLSGQLPYPADGVRATIRRRREEPPMDLRSAAGALPAGLVALVERMLAREPEDRPTASATVQQLVKLEIAALAPARRRAG